MKKRVHTFFVLTLISLQGLFAQPYFTPTGKEDVILIKNSILAVVVKSEEPKGKSKPDEYEQHKKSVAEFNAYLRAAVEREWDFSTGIEFVTEEEAKAIKLRKDGRYSIMELVTGSNYKLGNFSQSKTEFSDLNNPAIRAYYLSPSGTSKSLVISNASKPTKQIVISWVPVGGISQVVVTNMVLHLKNQLNDCELNGVCTIGTIKKAMKTRSQGLKTKTLLIPEHLIGTRLKNAIDKGEMKNIYGYKYEVVNFQRLDEIISTKDPAYAYLLIVPTGVADAAGQLYRYFTIDVQDARMIGITSTNVKFNRDQFNPQHFKLLKMFIKKSA
jgi:hypothetical protein